MIICGSCIKFDSISNFINENGNSDTCGYCGKNSISVDDRKIFKYIYDKLDKILVPINDLLTTSSLFYHANEDLQTFDSSADFIDNVFWSYQDSNDDFFRMADQRFLDRLIEYLPNDSEHGPYCLIIDSNRYSEIQDHEALWDSLVNRLNYEFRYINNSLIDAYDYWLSPLRKGSEIDHSQIRTLNKGDNLYRARIFKSQNEKNSIIDSPYRQVGPAPCAMTSEQRMTSSGVSAFYGALDRETCLAEVRCESGTTAISGCFKSLKDLKLLDLSVLIEVSYRSDFFKDPFIDGIDDIVIASEFSKTLYENLVRPAKNENQDVYRITQSFFEYLRHKYIKQIHGVCFPSIQADNKGTNVVIFPEYSVVCNNDGDVYSPYDERQNHPNKLITGFSKFNNNFSNEAVLIFCDGTLVEHRIRSVRFNQDSKNIS
ncbi:RES family NAD+ phosphorylase [Vibrio cincinnatiensis]|uniref:RES family NAD+ phosphorylase n=1 Tax=Vibrio cincinnatiensis TaxID=675 RepID=UPI0012ACADA9|nr:RES family NAD+ phosphorylase [Vibrio cincinnatiensis]